LAEIKNKSNLSLRFYIFAPVEQIKYRKTMLNIKTYFGGDAEGILLVLAGSMKTKCTGNANFVFSVTTIGHTTLTDFGDSYDAWHEAVLDANGDPEKEALALELRKVMEPLQTIVSNEVNAQANHVKSKLISSGGQLTTVAGVIGEFAAPVVEKIVSENSGTLEATLKTEAKALGTMVRLTNVATSVTIEWFTSHKHVILVTELTPGAEYALSFAFVGTNSTLHYSDPISRFPQK
jgi:hypothetical protein